MAGDIPGAEGGEVTARVGSGPIITLYDPGHVPHRALRDYVCEIADADVIHRDDLENAARLVAAVVKKLDAEALKKIRGF